MCEGIGRNFEDLSWSTGIMVAVIGEDIDDFENRKRDVIGQEWLLKKFPEETKKKMLEKGCQQDLARTPDMVVERILQYNDYVDVFEIGLPFVGNVRENGLETIRILKDYIAPKL